MLEFQFEEDVCPSAQSIRKLLGQNWPYWDQTQFSGTGRSENLLKHGIWTKFCVSFKTVSGQFDSVSESYWLQNGPSSTTLRVKTNSDQGDLRVSHCPDMVLATRINQIRGYQHKCQISEAFSNSWCNNWTAPFPFPLPFNLDQRFKAVWILSHNSSIALM